MYQFPVLSLNQGGTVTLHTATGSDTVTDLFWGQGTPVWSAGKKVLLSDPGGTLHTQFSIP
jgi:competence protein ComEC